MHCTAPFRFIQAAEPYMRAAGKKELEATGQASTRHIINISSTTGTHGNAGQANYATAKAGVVGLTKSIAKVSSGACAHNQARGRGAERPPDFRARCSTHEPVPPPWCC